MTPHYGRTAAERVGDYAKSKVFERHVRDHLPGTPDDRTDDVNALDFYVPSTTGEHPYFLECKEKNQKYGRRWHLLPNVEERDLFILDELSYRKARQAEEDHAAPAFILIHDRPCERLFLASTDHLSLVDRVRVNRIGPTGHPKGKLVIDVSHFHRVTLLSLHETVQAHIRDRRKDWGWSECLSQKELPHA